MTSEPILVRSDHGFDATRLAAYLAPILPGFESEIGVRQFEGGQSNPTYRLDTSAGAYVLRKKPAGKLLPSAHAIDREYAFMHALRNTIPVPRMLHYCADEEVIGQPFYVMEHVEGRMMHDARLLEAAQAERREMGVELMRVLARLHAADPREVGLGTYGRPGGYFARQLSRWAKQYAASRIEDNADMDRLLVWLDANMPATEEVSVIHGDYRNHNVLFAPDSARIVAVLDWELAAIGNPLADVAYCCLTYYLPADDRRGFHGDDPAALGIATEQELVDAYSRESGRSDLPHWTYSLVFSLFRTAAIRAGVFKRAHDGTAASAQAFEAGIGYRSAAAAAWHLAQTGRN